MKAALPHPSVALQPAFTARSATGVVFSSVTFRRYLARPVTISAAQVLDLSTGEAHTVNGLSDHSAHIDEISARIRPYAEEWIRALEAAAGAVVVSVETHTIRRPREGDDGPPAITITSLRDRFAAVLHAPHGEALWDRDCGDVLLEVDITNQEFLFNVVVREEGAAEISRAAVFRTLWPTLRHAGLRWAMENEELLRPLRDLTLRVALGKPSAHDRARALCEASGGA